MYFLNVFLKTGKGRNPWWSRWITERILSAGSQLMMEMEIVLAISLSLPCFPITRRRNWITGTNNLSREKNVDLQLSSHCLISLVIPITWKWQRMRQNYLPAVMPRCWSTVKRELEKNCLPKVSIMDPCAKTVLLWRWIVRLCRRICWNLNYLDMMKGHLQEAARAEKRDCLNWRKEDPCFWMKSVRYPRLFRRGFFGSFRRRKSCMWEETGLSRSMCVL